MYRRTCFYSTSYSFVRTTKEAGGKFIIERLSFFKSFFCEVVLTHRGPRLASPDRSKLITKLSSVLTSATVRYGSE